MLPMEDTREITALARLWGEGDENALERLIKLTYPKLREIARRHVSSRGPDPTIDTTALIHEAYLRFAAVEEGVWPSRAHFYAFCSKVMRRVLIDYARRRQAERRGGARIRVPLREDMAAVETQVADVLQVEEALKFLARRDERMATVVECRFFGGQSIDETAEVLNASPRTVVREWTRARAYLLRALDPASGPPAEDD
jgi:RNA polymerase sigma factor (TIGR02999 family)